MSHERRLLAGEFNTSSTTTTKRHVPRYIRLIKCSYEDAESKGPTFPVWQSFLTDVIKAGENDDILDVPNLIQKRNGQAIWRVQAPIKSLCLDSIFEFLKRVKKWLSDFPALLLMCSHVSELAPVCFFFQNYSTKNRKRFPYFQNIFYSFSVFIFTDLFQTNLKRYPCSPQEHV